MLRKNPLLLLFLILALVLAACGTDSGGDTGGDTGSGDTGGETGGEDTTDREPSDDPVSLTYELWDANQLPPYEQCVEDFMAENPNIRVEITQTGWGDYWNNIQTGMVAGTAPDVFTNHLAKYPEFASKEQLIDIQPFIERDNVDLGIYLEGLADLWARDGKRFGLPKDWDTIALVYNKEMLEAAGVTEEELNSATWNPEDGGTFEEIIARLTLDANGNNALSPDFDSDNVEQYGIIAFEGTDAGGAYGQTAWSHLAVSNGFSFIDNLYAEQYHYDDPALAETLDWFQRILNEKGYSPSYTDIGSLGGTTLFSSGEGAMVFDGSWKIGTYANDAAFDVGFARLPIGPDGRKSMFNGLADSIWAGTEHPEEAWELVKYLASPACANVVGDAGVVFPAQPPAVDRALAAYSARGLDVSAFTEQALEEGGTFLFPVTDNASEIADIMSEVMDSIMLGQAEPAEALPNANERVNATFR